MIAVKGVTFRFKNSDVDVFDGLDLTVPAGRLTAVLGASGCGKSTLLRLVAGLLQPQAGDVTLPPAEPDRAAFSLVFQDPRLLPWMSVEENLRFALRARGVDPAIWPSRTGPLLERVGLSGLEARRPATLSGGMAQRVALVRALALRPKALLLDEPFAAVDPLLREDLQAALQELLTTDADCAGLLVTHDVGEALVLGDEVVVLAGRPARIAGRVTVEAPRPRGEAFRLSGEFMALQARLRAVLAGGS